LGHEKNVSCAADTASDVLFLLRHGDFGPASNFVESNLSLLAFNELIDPFEGLIECLYELSVLVGLIVHELFGEDVSHVLTDLET
jgi:hypothetical protein